MFYHYRQNNSGGWWDIEPEKGVSVNVIIEAPNIDEANHKAASLGIYFYGVSQDMDCPCCGDRWEAPWHDDGNEAPSIYGRPVHEENATIGSNWAGSSPEGFIHYADGRMEAIWAGETSVEGWNYALSVTPWPLVEARTVEELPDSSTRAIAA